VTPPKPKPHVIVRNLADPSEPEKLYRANHSSLEEAVAQFELDLDLGNPVVRIEDAEGNTVREA
jgi:hypothetical protein